MTPPNLDPVLDRRECFDSYMGLWLVEPDRFCAAVEAVKDGTVQADVKIEAIHRGEDKEEALFVVTPEGIAVIKIEGFMMKAVSKFEGNTSTIQVRRALRAASRDGDVDAIVLQIDSGGGTVGGTEALADDVRMVDGIKPVIAQVDDFAASAAFWVASQARQVFANSTAEVGSIGVVAVLQDSSKMFQEAGVEVKVVSTGPFKGSLARGAPITKKDIGMVQERLDALHDAFVQAIARGRVMSVDKVQEAADGRVFIAPKALGMGLIDGVQNMDTTLAQLAQTLENDREALDRRRAETRLRLEDT